MIDPILSALPVRLFEDDCTERSVAVVAASTLPQYIGTHPRRLRDPFMQIHVHPVESKPSRGLPRVAAAVAALVVSQALFLPAARSEPRASAWADGGKSSVRLIAAASGSELQPWRVGVELRLSPGSLTYWRTPGGAGVAPIFDFASSVNIAKVTVGYPAPTRIEEEGTEVYGYHDAVTFPLDVTPHDALLPMSLALTLSYAVCDRICLPARATTRLDLPPRPTAVSPQAAEAVAIERARTTVPSRLSQQEGAAAVSISPIAGATPPAWRILVRDAAAQDLFAEAEAGWYFETRKLAEPGTFLIVEAETPTTGAGATVPVTLTVTGPRRSYELGVDLDRATAAR